MSVTAPTSITLGYAQITSNVTSTSTSAAQATGLTVTVTVPATAKRLRITGYCDYMYNSTTNNESIMTIWDGTVGSGTQLTRAVTQAYSSNTGSNTYCVAIITAPTGSKTYNIGLHTSATGTAGIEAGATFPAFIHVEALP